MKSIFDDNRIEDIEKAKYNDINENLVKDIKEVMITCIKQQREINYHDLINYFMNTPYQPFMLPRATIERALAKAKEDLL